MVNKDNVDKEEKKSDDDQIVSIQYVIIEHTSYMLYCIFLTITICLKENHKASWGVPWLTIFIFLMYSIMHAFIAYIMIIKPANRKFKKILKDMDGYNNNKDQIKKKYKTI